MFNNQNQNEEQNFWVSYADLMAGLLFVFILVLGAILIKYISIQDNLMGQNDLVDDLRIKLLASENNFENEQRLNSKLLLEKEDIETRLLSSESNFDDEQKLNAKLLLEKEDTEVKLLSSESDFENEQKLNAKLLLEKADIILELEETATKNQKIILVLENKDATLENINKSLKLSINEVSKLKDLALGYELREKEKSNTISYLENKMQTQSNSFSLSKEEVKRLASIILIQNKKHKSLVNEFNVAKGKIKRLTGIRFKVIKELKRKLGRSINIDNKSGAIRFSSNILFDQGKFKLKEKSKKTLSRTLKKYIKAILYNKKIRKHIDKIVIEGHTNTDGTYLHNLELSQKRALEVMKFLYSIERKNRKLLKRYVSASGRSYSDTIRFKNKKENKNASRRIEIKFQLKNEESIKQLSKYFNKKRK